MPATLEAPPAQQQSAAPVLPPPSLPPKVAAPPAPTPPKVPDTPKKRLQESGDEMSKFTDQTKDKPVVTKPVHKPPTPEGTETGESEGEPVAEGEPKAGQPEGDTKGKVEPKKEGKVWTLLKEKEARLAQLEKEFNEYKAKVNVDPEKEKQVTEKLTTYEKQNRELMEELQFHNYKKYNEDFKKNYEAPYHDAWRKAVEEISQLPVILEDGTTRAGTATDLSQLMDMAPVERREMAERMFGKYADDVIREAKAARGLFDKMTAHLDEAQKTIGAKEKERAEAFQSQHKVIADEAGKAWQEADKEAFAHEKYGKFFTPVEGDQDGNQRLAKGRKLAERAFTENPFNPSLTAEERATIVKRQNAVCNRASAFGRLVSWNSKLEARVAELEKSLAEYGEGEPTEGEGKTTNNGVPIKASQRAESELDKMAR